MLIVSMLIIYKIQLSFHGIEVGKIAPNLSGTVNLRKMLVRTKSKMANRYSPEARVRAVRTTFAHQGSYKTQAGATGSRRPRRTTASGMA